ncbi:hypothetical protein RIF29_12482 [Crotalaria pallida]|uniref:Pectinesterase inhibitor domain-containing protein n=1 Tax=Crotalaria pallida TaxID=3830 RepID=A0AAN9INA8_CROPI
MAHQNPLLVALILLTSLLLCVTSQTNEQAAQDAIDITIAEVSRAKDFIGLIPNLRSIRNVRGVPSNKVVQCVGDISDGISNVLSELNKLRQLCSGSSSTFYGGTRYLESTVDSVVSFKHECHHALVDEDVDSTIRVMVLRKLDDIVLLTNDVIFRVSRLHFDDDAKVTEKH